MKKITPYLVCLFMVLSSHKSMAQIYEFLPANTPLISTSPWQLVFNDEFNGNALDTTKWASYIPSWNPPGWVYNSDNSDDARAAAGSNYRDANTFISNGICNMIIKYDPNTWCCCDSCVLTSFQEASSGAIATRLNNFFHVGSRFEARIKMPTWNHNHTTFWTWAADRKSELDIVEDYVHPEPGGEYQTCSVHNFATHQDFNEPIYGIPGYLADQWHIYACEFDSNFITYYLDGQQIERIPKLIDQNTNLPVFGPNSAPTGRTYEVNALYPRDSVAYQARVTLGRDGSGTTYPGISTDTLQVDYVRIYQRHPEQDGHKNLDNRSITGPNTICDLGQTYTFTAFNFGPHITWEFPLGTKIVSETATTITVRFASGISGAQQIFVDDGNGFLPGHFFNFFIGPPTCGPNMVFAASYGINSNNNYIWQMMIFDQPGITYDLYVSSGDSSAQYLNISDYYTCYNLPVFLSNSIFVSYTLIQRNACGSTVCQDYAYGAAPVGRPFNNTTSIPNTTTTETKIYPNPATDEVFISLGSKYAANKPATLKVMNALGQVMARQIITPTGTPIKIDTKAYVPGLYIIKINEDEYKFVKE